jgi:SHS2 domain-containing protein
MSYVWESHTGEAQLRVTAGSEEEVFLDAIDAFARFVERGRGGEAATHVVEVEAEDRGALLVQLIDELVYLADTEGFVADRARVALEGDRLHAELDGRATDVAPLVKAATYHDLRFERHGEEWDARIVLDV